mgnify:FL=1
MLWYHVSIVKQLFEDNRTNCMKERTSSKVYLENNIIWMVHKDSLHHDRHLMLTLEQNKHLVLLMLEQISEHNVMHLKDKLR